eukprot:56390-Rhodomonas_salina.1
MWMCAQIGTEHAHLCTSAQIGTEQCDSVCTERCAGRATAPAQIGTEHVCMYVYVHVQIGTEVYAQSGSENASMYEMMGEHVSICPGE